MSKGEAAPRKETRELVKKLEQQGWVVRRSKHLTCYAPNGKDVVILPVTGNRNGAGVKNAIAALRRAGADV